MKTKDLIKLLRENDPEGEIEVCVGNVPVHYVDNLPAYYDGLLQVLIPNPIECKYYNVEQAKFVSSGRKVVIHTWGIDDAIYENPDLPVEIENDNGRYAEMVEKWRAEGREIETHIMKIKAEKEHK
jgi:hypothetical protein